MYSRPMLRVRVNLSGASMTNGVATHNFNMTAGSGTEAAAQDCSTAVWNLWALLIQQMPLTAAAQVDSVSIEATGLVLNLAGLGSVPLSAVRRLG